MRQLHLLLMAGWVCLSRHALGDQVPSPALPRVSLDEARAKAAGGDRAAQYELGLRYFVGDGVPKDDAEAAR